MRAGLQVGLHQLVRVLVQGARAKPGRPRRWALCTNLLDHRTLDGGRDEWSGVLGGRVHSAISALRTAISANASCRCCASVNTDRISASFYAWVIRLSSISGLARVLNRDTRGRVKTSTR